MGSNHSTVAPTSPPVAQKHTPRTSAHSTTVSKATTSSSKSIVYRQNNREGDTENAEESLKSICKNDGLRRACLKFCIGCDIDFMFHVFIEATTFLEHPTESEAFEMLRSFRERFESEHSIQVISRYEWQKMHDLITSPDATCSFDNARATIVTCKQIAVIGLSLALDSFLDSAIFENWERNRVKQELNVLSNAPIRRGLARYGSCPNPRLIHVQNSVAAATAWVNDPELSTMAKVSAFATVFPNILVVDDSTVSVKLSATSIQADGHNVRSAHNGKVGYAMAMRGNYQIIIVDIFMPVMNGFELIRLLRQHNNQLEGSRSSRGSHVGHHGGGGEFLDGRSDASTKSFTEIDAMNPVTPTPYRELNGSYHFSHNNHNNNSNYFHPPPADATHFELEENNYTPVLWKHPPIVIAMTADNDDENIIKAFEAGADYFIEKPMTISKLADCLL